MNGKMSKIMRVITQINKKNSKKWFKSLSSHQRGRLRAQFKTGIRDGFKLGNVHA